MDYHAAIKTTRECRCRGIGQEDGKDDLDDYGPEYGV
jgi:hypothetical protein